MKHRTGKPQLDWGPPPAGVYDEDDLARWLDEHDDDSAYWVGDDGASWAMPPWPTPAEVVVLIWGHGGHGAVPTRRFFDEVSRLAPAGFEVDFAADMNDLIVQMQRRRVSRKDIALEVLRHLHDAGPLDLSRFAVPAAAPKTAPAAAAGTVATPAVTETPTAAAAPTAAADEPAAGPGGDAVVPLRPGYLPVKAVVEWVVALTLAALAAPLILVLALLVRLGSRGPAFDARPRVGRGGRTFRLFYLRATEADWVGRLLRRIHLEALPQLVNVLRGEMALIGPRPEHPVRAANLARALPGYLERLRVRPGLAALAIATATAGATGAAPGTATPDGAVNAAGQEEHLHLVDDLHYVRTVGPATDLRVALTTAAARAYSGLHAVGHLVSEWRRAD